MHDAVRMRRIHRVRDLQHDRRNFVVRQRRVAFRVTLEQFAGGPLDREEVHAFRGLTSFDRPHYVRVLHSRAERRFAHEAGDCRSVLAQALAQDFHGDFAVLGMLSSVDGRGTSLADAVEEGITGQRCPDERVARHAGEANGTHTGLASELKCSRECRVVHMLSCFTQTGMDDATTVVPNRDDCSSAGRLPAQQACGGGKPAPDARRRRRRRAPARAPARQRPVRSRHPVPSSTA